MTHPIHTLGPVIVSGTTIQTESPPRFIATVGAPSDRGPEELANARLLAAAYNAFDSAARVLNVNATELAERMQDRELAELVESLREVLRRFRSCIDAAPKHELSGDKPAIERAEAVLAKLKGGLV